MPDLPIEHWLVVVSASISIFGVSKYIKDTIEGNTKPNKVSWGMWALAPLIGTGAAICSNADFWSLIRVFLAGFLPLLVFIASFINRQSYWKLTLFDYLCACFSIVALIIWLFINQPKLAILIAALADFFACFPTFKKAWHYPETESGAAYITGLISVILIFPSIPNWNIENSSFPIYLLCSNSLLLLAVYRKKLVLT